MRKLEVSDTDTLRQRVKQEISCSQHIRFVQRLQCVLLVGEGCNCYDIAKWFGVNPRTIARWVHSYAQHGVTGLKDDPKTGRPAKLTIEHLNALQHDISRPPRELGHSQQEWDGKLLSIHLERNYDINLSLRQSQRLLRRLRQDSICNDIDQFHNSI